MLGRLVRGPCGKRRLLRLLAGVMQLVPQVRDLGLGPIQLTAQPIDIRLGCGTGRR